MAGAEPEPVPTGPPFCVHCGDVIGVYEPIVQVIDGQHCETSRAAQPHLSESLSAVNYHAVCYGLTHGPAAT
jgi:hypothetical protein